MLPEPASSRRSPSLTAPLAATALLACVAPAARAGLTDPIPEKIEAGPVNVRLSQVATGVGTPIDLEDLREFLDYVDEALEERQTELEADADMAGVGPD